MATIKNKVNFKTKTEDQKEIDLCVKRPDHKISREAHAIYARVWRQCAESKDYILRENLKKILRENNLWDDEKDKLYVDLNLKIITAEKALKAGGKKLSEGKQLAFDLADYRFQLQNLVAETNKYDENTAEAQAENARFDFLCSKCIVDPNKDGDPWFESYDDFCARKTEKVAFDGASELAKMIYGMDTDFQKKRPENEFLIKYGFMDDRLRLINKEGNFVDRDNKLINEDGRYVNEKGEFINAGGEKVDEQGNVVVKSDPFIDDETGEPV